MEFLRLIRYFKQYICFSFSQVKVYDSINTGHGPYVLWINGVRIHPTTDQIRFVDPRGTCYLFLWYANIFLIFPPRLNEYTFILLLIK